MKDHSINKVLRQAQKHIDKLDAQVLLAHVMGMNREYLLSHDDKNLTLIQRWAYQSLIRKRQKNIPVAYLLKKKEFFGLNFFVNKNVLVPRPETETLVENVVEYLKSKVRNQRVVLIDVGTGSGCIPISIMRACEQTNIQAHAIDISSKALKVAKKNAKKHNVDVAFIQGNLLSPILNNSSTLNLPSSIVITANLPYVPESDYVKEPSIQKEPKLALVADNHGMALYKTFINQLGELVSLTKTPLSCIMEMDPSQIIPLKKQIQTILPQATVEVIQDLSGRDRFLYATILDK